MDAPLSKNLGAVWFEEGLPKFQIVRTPSQSHPFKKIKITKIREQLQFFRMEKPPITHHKLVFFKRKLSHYLYFLFTEKKQLLHTKKRKIYVCIACYYRIQNQRYAYYT